MRRARRGRTGSKHLSLSATDAEWETVRRNAQRRGPSIARYLVGLVERDGAEEDTGPALALSADEQRELLAAVREVRALVLEGEDAALRHECPLVRDMQERIAVMFTAWASALAAAGRAEELRAALVAVLGAERARIAAASVVASVAPPAAQRAKASQAGGGRADPRQDRLL